MSFRYKVKSWRSRLSGLGRRKSHSIASRHLKLFLLFVMLPVWVILILFTLFFRHQIVESAKNQRLINLHQYASSINVDLQNMSIITSSLIHNTALRELSEALSEAKNSTERYLIFSEIENLLQTYSNLSRQLVGFSLVFEGESSPYVSRNSAGIMLSREEINTYIDIADSTRGFILIPDSLNYFFGQSSGRYIVSLVISSFAREGTYNTGIRTLIVSFVMNPLWEFIRQNNSVSLSDYFLVGRNGLILASNDDGVIDTEMTGIKQSYRKSRIVIETPVEISGWTLAEAVNINALTEPFNIIFYMLYAAIFIIVLFFIRYNAFFFARILNPLKFLIDKMEAVGNGNFLVRAETGDFSELNKISESFNYMVEKISLLTESIKQEHAERIRTEIEALRYQLNPHFLCNALNSIRMMALITKNDAITKMSQALMMITEDTLAREDTIYSLEHELYILENYVYIMKVRYGDTFELIKDVDSPFLQLGIPSMILQPLVENAILHGFNELPRPGLIVVSAVPGDNKSELVISVKDNGNGMSPETLEGIFNADKPYHKGLSKIGLYNVRRRIILAYGNAYGVDVSSFPGEGTVVTLKLPVQKTEGHESRFKRE